MNRRGITLVELLIVLAIVGILLGLSAPPFFEWVGESQLENRALQLYSDLKWAQSVAQDQGDVGINNQVIGGILTATPLKRRVFVAIDTDDGGYRIYRWQDENADGVYNPGEFDPEFENTTDAPIRQYESLSPAVPGRLSQVDDAACSSGTTNSSGAFVSINNCPTVSGVFSGSDVCIRFNSKGFYEGGNNAAIYLKSGEHQYALAINITGTIRLCQLVEEDLDGDGDKWDWRIIK